MFIFFLEFLRWLSVFGWYAWAAGAFYEALFPAIWGVLILPRFSGQGRQISFGNLIIPAASYTAMEAARNLGPLGMPWGDLAYTQWKFLPLIQIGSVTGALGVSFIVATLNFCLYYALRTKKTFWAAAGVSCLIIPMIFGVFRLQHFSASSVPVALLQTYDTQLFKWDRVHFQSSLAELDGLVKKAAKTQPDLIIFPETSLADNFNTSAGLQALAKKWAVRSYAYLAIGTLWREGGREENTLVMVSPAGQILRRYVKVKLVPFGEYLPLFFRPLRGQWHVLDKIVDDRSGRSFTVFSMEKVNFGAMICFESSFGWIARQLALNGAQFLAVSTNDAWFYQTSAQEMHAVMAVYRAIETGRSCVQAGNTGISCAADERGRILAWNNEKHSAVVRTDVPLENEFTVYDGTGDFFPYLCMIATALYILLRPFKPHENAV